MHYKILLKANINRHKGSLIAVFLLVFIAMLSLVAVLCVYINSSKYLNSQMERMGFGDLTAWVSGTDNFADIATIISQNPDVEKANSQSIIFANYQVNSFESDSEGQLIAYQPELYPYKIFKNDLSAFEDSPLQIAQGEIYLPPSLVTIANCSIGDEISFTIARSSKIQTFKIAGFFEDPFMGSSMIGMKSFLINANDFTLLLNSANSAGVDALARQGAMLHIFKAESSTSSLSQWNALLNSTTPLPNYTEFAHSQGAIAEFMQILQNIFSIFALCFTLVLLIVTLIIISHCISTSLEQDFVNIGILKCLGFTSKMLFKVQILHYLVAILPAILLALLVSPLLLGALNRALITTTGMLVPSSLPIFQCIIALALVVCILLGFIMLKIQKIGNITPINALTNQSNSTAQKGTFTLPIKKRFLSFSIAFRQLVTGKKQYVGVFIVAMLLVFFASMVGRLNAWLGEDGKGLMDAFNPADVDIGVEYFGEATQEDIEATINQYTAITQSYMLLMPSVTINGIDFTANVITESERFAIITGNTCTTSDEIVLTEVAAKDLGVWVGDLVEVSGASYTVSGIYQCANDMGANLGMTSDGYAKIGEAEPSLWCLHYFLQDIGQRQAVIDALESTFGGDVRIHLNSWTGLSGIISAMKALIIVMYIIVAIVVLIVTGLTGSKILMLERKNMGIYMALGFSLSSLQNAFALRFAIVSLLGSFAGSIFCLIFCDSLLGTIMKLCSISNFTSLPSLQSIVVPIITIVALFFAFAFASSKSLKKLNLPTLFSS